ncbi:ABC transporter ATP-binding protein [Macrococcus brunensis]|uniref:ABC transporter ATP-binding protein n=1 Tax=Macrococcus brunensis TaxID=198483 RepID=A0A4V3BD82_9STAP|nr:ABC transporter ATP-binding protein [Macrococcus brunensis]TDL94136.1 ABC transporter ATP-binding protein [Macrococcus brunensis]ULG71443.1 ABC transporter ATP-binding protein [Macrococcus brunensis]ULG73740.1 ABC transporter ATP-binding protein [Macrococcus brunensis]
MTVEVRHLTGGYGNQPVIHDIDFTLKAGEIVGLIGLNGAGKSTTIKNMLGLLQPMKGDIAIDGITLSEAPYDYRQKISYIPESPVLYDELTLEEHIDMTAMAYGLTKEEAMTRSEPMLKIFRLEDKLKQFPQNFSKGMKQKVMIICAFISQPELHIIDEPFLGLDPLGIQSMLDLMVQARQAGRTVLMSTHILATAEKYCDYFLIMHQGHLVAKGTIHDLQTELNMPGESLDAIYIKLTQGDQHV